MFREREIWEKSSFSRASSEKMAYLKFSIWKNNIPWRWKLWTKGPNLFIKLCSARLDTSLICLHRIKYSLTSPLCQHHYESSTAQLSPSQQCSFVLICIFQWKHIPQVILFISIISHWSIYWLPCFVSLLLSPEHPNCKL